MDNPRNAKTQLFPSHCTFSVLSWLPGLESAIILVAATSTQLSFVTKKFYDLQDVAVYSLLLSGVLSGLLCLTLLLKSLENFLFPEKTILPTLYVIQLV